MRGLDQHDWATHKGLRREYVKCSACGALRAAVEAVWMVHPDGSCPGRRDLPARRRKGLRGLLRAFRGAAM